MAELQTRRDLLIALRLAHQALLDAAERAGDDDFWNDGGQGYRAFTFVGHVIGIETAPVT